MTSYTRYEKDFNEGEFTYYVFNDAESISINCYKTINKGVSDEYLYIERPILDGRVIELLFSEIDEDYCFAIENDYKKIISKQDFQKLFRNVDWTTVRIKGIKNEQLTNKEINDSYDRNTGIPIRTVEHRYWPDTFELQKTILEKLHKDYPDITIDKALNLDSKWLNEKNRCDMYEIFNGGCIKKVGGLDYIVLN